MGRKEVDEIKDDESQGGGGKPVREGIKKKEVEDEGSDEKEKV